MRVIRRDELASRIAVVVAVILTGSAIFLPWHHHSILHVSSNGESTTDLSFYLVEWRNKTDDSISVLSYDHDSTSAMPIDNLMTLTLSLVVTGLIASIVITLGLVLGLRKIALVAGVASIVSISIAVILFYLLIGDSFEDSRLMSANEPSFSGEESMSGWHGEGTYFMTWGPQAGFWLAIVAAAVLCLAVFLVARGRRKD